MANIKQGQQMIPFISCEIPLCQDVCKLVLGVDVFDLDLRVKINSIEQPIKSNSMSSGNMSHCWTSAFHNHFNHSFIVQTHTIKLHDLRIEHLMEPNQCLSPHRFYCETSDVCEYQSQVSPDYLKHEKHFQGQKQLDPIVPEHVTHPISVLCPERDNFRFC